MSSSNYLRSLVAEANERIGVDSKSWTARTSAALVDTANHIDNLYEITETQRDKIKQFKSALASERAARTAAEEDRDMYRSRGDSHLQAWLASEATIRHVRKWHQIYNKFGVRTDEDLDSILAAAPSAALDAHDAQVKSEALEAEADRLGALSHTMRNLGEDRARYLAYADIAVGLRNQAAEIRKAAQ